MSTTVTNTNPVIISGGTMASGARATIYPNQIKRSFKVTKVVFIGNPGVAGDSFVIKDNSSTNNVLLQGTITAANTVLTYDFPLAVTWADWIVTTLTNATSDTLMVFLK